MSKVQTAAQATDARRDSHLFYLSSLRRPLIDRAEGIYMWTQDGRRFIDGSSGPMVANIGHSNRNVLDAMKRQMDRATFAYRLHFENEPAEELARELAGKLPEGMD
ncbi:aminotransferase class III-fold pyridoxal phosphate-dependent enzyme, partial [Mesorhizobium sp. M7A.F.Ca.CA.004.08.2.1]